MTSLSMRRWSEQLGCCEEGKGVTEGKGEERGEGRGEPGEEGGKACYSAH